jgi:transposase
MILHYNASANKTGAVTQFLTESHISTLPHPAYSPDLVQCDFWLFPKPKEL